MAWLPEAAVSFCTANGENRLWPDRLSSSTVNTLPPLVLLDEELLEDELEELDELPLEDELEELDELLLEEEDEVPPARLISTTLACASRKAL